MNTLCDDILYCIIKYLKLNDTLNVRLISKQFDDILNDKLLWKSYYKRDYDVEHKDLNNLSKKMHI